MIIKIGMDVEFIAYKRGALVYPSLEEKGQLSHFGCDEFGHCVEVRPEKSDTATGLILNTMEAMSKLPEGYKYLPVNALLIPKKDYFDLLRKEGSKPVPECKNIYGKEILEETQFEIYAKAKKKRVVYCGMHIHVSGYAEKTVLLHKEGHKDGILKAVKVPIPLPMRLLTFIFDEVIYSALSDDENFTAGRYRSPGFCEEKGSGHFEYRSLGSTAFTPKRVSLIFEIVKHIIEVHDHIFRIDGKVNLTPPIVDMVKKLVDTKPNYKKDLKDMWAPWIV